MLERSINNLTVALGGRSVSPPIPPGCTVCLSQIEALTDDVEISPPDDTASTSRFIEYTNAKGEDSARVITFRSISGNFGKPETIGAHCHQSRRYKNFSIENIRSMTCAFTGEELDPVAHCIALHRKGALKIEDKVLIRIMRILTFLARCDGEFHSAEREAIDDVLGRYFRFFGGDDDAYECARREAIRLAPTGTDVVNSVKFIARAPLAGELAGFLVKASASIIDADGFHRSEELAWGVELGSMLRKIIEHNR